MKLYILIIFFLYSFTCPLAAMDQERVYKGTEWNPIAYANGSKLPIASFVHFLQTNNIQIKGRKVLDVACGTGEITQHLATEATHVHAIDASENMVNHFSQQISQKNLKNISTQHCCIENFLPTQLYNLATLSSSYYWLENPEQALKRIHNSLEINGEFFANIETVSNNPLITMAVVQDMLNNLPLFSSTLSCYNISATSTLPEKTKIKNLLEQTGFTLITYDEQLFTCAITKKEFEQMIYGITSSMPAITYIPGFIVNILSNSFIDRCLKKMDKINDTQYLYTYFTTIVHAVKNKL